MNSRVKIIIYLFILLFILILSSILDASSHEFRYDSKYEYLAPEFINTRCKISEKSDIYSLLSLGRRLQPFHR